MYPKFEEESVIFISILKWSALSAVVGVIVGLSTTLFLKLLTASIDFLNQFSLSYLLLPAALLVSALLIRYLAPEASGQGTDRVIEAVHKRSGKINAIVVPVKLLATVITIAFGGSAGKIGPCAQIGGGLSSLFADLFHFADSDRRKLVICGISAGFASVFGTPIAGAIFGVEVLFVGSILYDVLLPSFVAGLVSYRVASSLGITFFHSPIEFTPVFNESFLVEVILGGIFFGLCSFCFIEILKFGQKISAKIQWNLPWKGLIGGAALILLTLIFSRQFLGLGFETIQSALEGKGSVWYGFLMKMIFTSITLNFGGSGGIVVPVLFVGATSGSLWGEILGENAATFSAIGFVSVLAGATNTPIAASILALELFGPDLAAYAALACVISFLMTGHRSIHSTQVLAVRKSASIQVQVGQELSKVDTKIKMREKSLLHLLSSLIAFVRRKFGP